MKASIIVRCERGVWGTLRIVNDGDSAASIHNPGNPRPTEGWAHSAEAFRIAVLRSFRVLEVTMRGADDGTVLERDVRTRANYAAPVPMQLQPGAAFELAVPLHELFALTPGASYFVEMTYGDAGERMTATASFSCPANHG